MDSVTLAEVLSPSQISQFLNCPAKWMFRYLLDLKDQGQWCRTRSAKESSYRGGAVRYVRDDAALLEHL